MKKFLLNLSLYLGVSLLISIIIVLLPATPGTRLSILYSAIQKDSLLVNTPKPRMIMIGGSSLAYGINSQILADSLKVNPINMGIHAGIGLKYMLDDVEPYLKEGDILLILPEYQQFFGQSAYGSSVLWTLMLDVSYSNIKKIGYKQFRHILPYLIKYITSKLKMSIYKTSNLSFYYTYKVFNEYGDASLFWGEKYNVEYFPMTTYDAEFDVEVYIYMLEFIKRVRKNNIKVFLGYPALEEQSFKNLKTNLIQPVQEKYENSGVQILGIPEDFMMPDSLIFDNPYHLNEQGANRRTKILLGKLKEALNNKKKTKP